MASFGFGELPDAGGTDVFSARKRGKPAASDNGEKRGVEMPDGQDHRLKLPRGQIPTGMRGKVDEALKKNLPTSFTKPNTLR